MGTVFFYSLTAGMMAVLSTADSRLVAWKFVRMVATMVFGIVCLVTYWRMQASDLGGSAVGGLSLGTGVGMGVAAMLLIFWAPVCASTPRLFRVVCGLGGASGLIAALAASPGVIGAPVPGALFWGLLGLSTLTGAMMLGSITLAWLLGHAYLTATRMTIEPLRHFSRMLLFCVGARCAFLVISVVAGWWLGSVHGASFWAVLANSWLVLSLRVGVGIIAVAVFAYMVADCVRLRATQSATGILYFASIFVYVGELASRQLLVDCGWPF
ncbi:MAG: hypothetical protein ACE5E5_12350 [Phycisphaerae bacterium]